MSYLPTKFLIIWKSTNQKELGSKVGHMTMLNSHYNRLFLKKSSLVSFKCSYKQATSKSQQKGLMAHPWCRVSISLNCSFVFQMINLHRTEHTFLSLLTDHSSTDTRASLLSLTAVRKDSASSMSSSADSPDEEDVYPSGSWPPGIWSLFPRKIACDFGPFSAFFCRVNTLSLAVTSLTFGVKSLKWANSVWLL